LDFSLDPNFGLAELESGFVPDPYEVELVSGGAVNVSELNLDGGCTGFATSAPDFRIFWSGDSFDFRIFFVPDEEGEDATLIVNTAEGEWVCNDDYSGWNPLVQIDEPPEGQYDIWLGSYSPDSFIAGTLYITELDLDPDSYTGGEPGGELDYTLDPNFGSVDLEAGFLPDPYEVELVSGGSVDVSSLDLDGAFCRGYATSAPDFAFFWSGMADNLRVFFVPDEVGEDATLILNSAEAIWYCNDDYSGLNPLIEIESPPAGRYDIWVGSYGPDDFIAGTLYITELGLDPGDFAGGDGEGQISQWASGATASSEFSNPGWSAMQATGVPDTDRCADLQTAWASSSSTGIDWLEVTYDTPVVPTEIDVYETHSPGFVVSVEVIDETGGYYTIWEGDPEEDAACPRVFSLSVTGVDFPIEGVRLHLDQTNGSWNEIDAVRLVGRPE
jgi:serine protease Do